MRIEAIKPKRQVIPVANLERRVDRELRDWAADMIRTMATYPRARPWKNPPPKSGPRRGGRRTGSYGRQWQIGKVTASSIEVLNRIPYGVHVGGPKDGSKGRRQARAMAERDWPNITDASREVWTRHRGAIVRVVTVMR